MPTLVIIERDGDRHLDRRDISPLAFIPHSHISTSVSDSADSTVNGTPIRLLKLTATEFRI